MNPNTKPKLKRTYSIVAHSPDHVELRKGLWNSSAVSIHDASNHHTLYEMVSMLDGKTTLSDIMTLVDLPAESVIDFIHKLDDFELLEHGHQSALDYYIDDMDPLRVDKLTHQKKNILLLGDEKICTEIQWQLHEFIRKHGVKVDYDDMDLHQLFVQRYSDWTLDTLKKTRLLESLSSWKNQLVVYVSCSIDPILMQYLNLVSRELNIDWMFSGIDGPMLLVGPTFSDDTPCFECFEHRIMNAMFMRENYLNYKKSLATKDKRLSLFPVVEPIKKLLASHVALEIINHSLNGSNFTQGKCLSIYIPTMEFAFNEFYKVSECKVCGLKGKPSKRQYFDFEHLLKEERNVISINTISE